MGHYLFNFSRRHAAKAGSLREQAAASLRVKLWGVDADEPHRDALAPGDLTLIYLAEPERAFIGRAELGSAVREWTPAEAQMYPGDSPSGVVLALVEEWDPPVPMNAVLPESTREGRTPTSRRMPRRASERASYGSPFPNTRRCWRFGRNVCPRLADL